jgi:AraC-like DNA-binding protein
MLTRGSDPGLKKRDMARPKLEKPRGILNVRADEPMPGMWRYWPSDDLAPFVEHYWTIEWDVPEPIVRETLPHPSVHLILEQGRNEELAGVATSKFTRVIEGKSRVFSVKFYPGGFRPFIDAPVSTLSNRVFDLSEVLGASARGLCDRALAHADHQSTIDVIENFLRAFHPRADDSLFLVQRIAGRVIDDRTITRVEQIVDEFDIGKRTLQRVFDDYVGVSPKWIIQRFRLHEAAERIASSANVRWSAIALELGYADQAHFIRDFKKLIGKSPADYSRMLYPERDDR